LQVRHDGDEVATPRVDVDPPREPPVLGAQHWRSVDDPHLRDRGQRDLRAHVGDDRQHAYLVDRVAKLPRVADVDREARQALDRFADVLSAHRGGDDVLNFDDVEPVTGRDGAVDRHVDISAAFEALG
jgi:hypothetical protein